MGRSTGDGHLVCQGAYPRGPTSCMTRRDRRRCPPALHAGWPVARGMACPRSLSAAGARQDATPRVLSIWPRQGRDLGLPLGGGWATSILLPSPPDVPPGVVSFRSAAAFTWVSRADHQCWRRTSPLGSSTLPVRVQLSSGSWAEGRRALRASSSPASLARGTTSCRSHPSMGSARARNCMTPASRATVATSAALATP